MTTIIKSGVILGLAAFTFWLMHQIDFAQFKRIFYSITFGAGFVYLVLLIRALVKFVEAKTKP